MILRKSESAAAAKKKLLQEFCKLLTRAISGKDLENCCSRLFSKFFFVEKEEKALKCQIALT